MLIRDLGLFCKTFQHLLTFICNTLQNFQLSGTETGRFRVLRQSFCGKFKIVCGILASRAPPFWMYALNKFILKTSRRSSISLVAVVYRRQEQYKLLLFAVSVKQKYASSNSDIPVVVQSCGTCIVHCTLYTFAKCFFKQLYCHVLTALYLRESSFGKVKVFLWIE